MYLTTYYKNIQGRRYGPYQSLRISRGCGKRSSLHIRKGMSQIESALMNPDAAGKFFEKEEEWQRRKRATRRLSSRHFHSRGMKSLFPPDFAEMTKSAGWNLQGRRMLRSRKRFFTIEAARIRFSLLDKASQDFVRSPERLLRACLLANKKLKSASARHLIGVNFDRCLAETLADIQ